MIRFMPSVTSRSPIGAEALAYLLAACSGSGGTTKKPEEDDEDGDGTGTRGAGGMPDPNGTPDPNDHDDDNKNGQQNMPVTPPPDDDDDTNPSPSTIDQKPTELSLDVNSRSFVENTDTSSRIELATITITDDGQGTNKLNLSDIVRFVVDGGKLYLKPNTDLDYETALGHKHEVTLTLSATGTGRLPDPVIFTLHILNSDEAPVLTISGSQTLTLNEGVTVTATDTGIMVTATDPDTGDVVTLTISDNRFEITGGKLQVKSGQTFDFETEPTVDVTVTASSSGKTVQQTVTIEVTDIDEALVIAREDGTAVGAALTVGSPENQLAVIDLKATPTISGGAIIWSLEGVDKDLFHINSEGVITWRAAPDFEATLSDADSQAFSLIAIASDSRDGVSTDSVSITVNLENIDEAGSVADFSTTPVVGKKLYPPQITDPDSPGGVVIIKNQWHVRENGNWVEKSTDDGYIPAPADVGKQIQLVVTYRDAFGDKTLTTNPSAAVIEATQSLFTNVQTATTYLAEAIPYPAGHKLASFDLTSGAEVQSVAISLQDEAGLVRLQKIGSRYEIVLSKEKEFDFETEVRTGNYNYDFTVKLTKTDGQTQDIGFSLPFKNGFGPSDKGADDITPQQFNTINGLWYPLPDNTPSNMRQTTFDSRKQAVLDRMAQEGGYDPSFLFYWGNMARDEVFGTVNNDILYGNGGNDALSGGAGDDQLSGDSGNDFLSGQQGNDILVGGPGEDELYGGGFQGKNTLTGGRDADKFTLVKADSSTDIITDFNRSEGDKILYGHVTSSAANLAAIGLRKELNSDNNLQLVDAGNNRIYMIFDGLNQLSDITITDFELI